MLFIILYNICRLYYNMQLHIFLCFFGFGTINTLTRQGYMDIPSKSLKDRGRGTLGTFAEMSNNGLVETIMVIPYIYIYIIQTAYMVYHCSMLLI